MLLGITTFWQAVASGIALIVAIGLGAFTHVIQQRIAAAEARRLAAGAPG